jgi:hydrogenase expression/formation protein HypD
MKAVISRIKDLKKSIRRPVRLMEVCGTHTVAIFKHGIRSLLPDDMQLLSGPGCPVCVTSIKDVDTVLCLAKKEQVTVVTFGDMMRVPGNKKSLFQAKSEGCDIRIVYSPLDALAIAQENENKTIIFFATGFETTSPSIAGTIQEADKHEVNNFYIYSTHKLVPPALKALLSSGDVLVDGFILPGHVSTIIGSRPYDFIASDYHKPSVITGFDAGDILEAIMMLLDQIASERSIVENQYSRIVRQEGNPKAMALIDEYFEPVDAVWRGIGTIPKSGLALRSQHKHRDITSVFSCNVSDAAEPRACACGDVLKGIKIPTDCALFGRACTPEKPVGACMVSSEGSCAAYYKYSGVTRL